MGLLSSLNLSKESVKGLKTDNFAKKYKVVPEFKPVQVNARDFGVMKTTYGDDAFFAKSIELDDEDRDVFGLPASATHIPVKVAHADAFDVDDFELDNTIIEFDGGKESGRLFADLSKDGKEQIVPAILRKIEAIADITVATGRLQLDGTEEVKLKTPSGTQFLQIVLGGTL